MNTPIVGMSAEVDPAIRKQCVEVGMKDLHAKSLAPENMQDIILEYTAQAAA